MSFISLGFAVFTAISLASFYVCPRTYRPILLFFLSAAFYLSAGVLPYIYVSALTLYLCSRGIECAETIWTRRAVLWICIAINIGILLFFKVRTFVLGDSSTIINTGAVIPLGMSFYTLSGVGYITDVYRKRIRAVSLFRLTLFLTFFPALVQGPISKYGDLEDALTSCSGADGEGLRAGLLRLAYGYFKKLVIADTVAVAVRGIVEQGADVRGILVLLLIFLYTAQIYCDFSGGIDIALGLSEMLGIRLPENFKSPFLSLSVKEYWRRWHMTLGAWLSEYIFYPVSLCRPMQKLTARLRSRISPRAAGRIPVYTASAVTWLVSGLWHGLGANFILWGMCNCAAILLSQEVSFMFGRRLGSFDSVVWKSARRLGTMLTVGAFRLLDVYGSVSLTATCFWRLLTLKGGEEGIVASALSLGLSLPEYAVIIFGVIIISLISRYGETHEDSFARTLARSELTTGLVAAVSFIFVIIFGAYGKGYDASGFIYNQF